jgi:hypothetical protein
MNTSNKISEEKTYNLWSSGTGSFRINFDGDYYILCYEIWYDDWTEENVVCDSRSQPLSFDCRLSAEYHLEEMIDAFRERMLTETVDEDDEYTF